MPSELHGAILLFYSVCVYLTVSKWISSSEVAERWSDVLPKVVAAVTVVALWWVEGEFRHHWSPEAKAKEATNRLIEAWSDGDRQRVFDQLDEWELDGPPWEYEREPSDYGLELC